jgi:3-dehydroquinate synthase
LKSYFANESHQLVFHQVNETEKTLRAVEAVLIQLSDLGMKKNHRLSVFGGGHLQDIGTLAASLYMRGVTWDYFPTTLAAMADSCIGGKSSINVRSQKNLIGNFYPPLHVTVDSAFTQTLPYIDVVSGIAEIIKICFARSFETFEDCLSLLQNINSVPETWNLEKLIRLSLVSKKYFIEEDEFDTGVRKFLNFGHTFGHALESASDFRIPHGIAVFIGMIAACEHENAFKNHYSESLVNISLHYLKSLSSSINPILSEINLETFSNTIAGDKKNTQSELVLILPDSNGLKIHKHPFSNGAIEKSKEALIKALEMVSYEVR